MSLRYAKDAVKELKQIDPDCPLTERHIRALAKQNIIASICIGNRRLISMESLLNYISHQFPQPFTSVPGIRPLH